VKLTAFEDLAQYNRRQCLAAYDDSYARSRKLLQDLGAALDETDRLMLEVRYTDASSNPYVPTLFLVPSLLTDALTALNSDMALLRQMTPERKPL
jgi:hypothetical protein